MVSCVVMGQWQGRDRSLTGPVHRTFRTTSTSALCWQTGDYFIAAHSHSLWILSNGLMNLAIEEPRPYGGNVIFAA